MARKPLYLVKKNSYRLVNSFRLFLIPFLPMIFGAFSISTFDGIPLCATLFRFFSKQYGAQKWVLAQCFVENAAQYDNVEEHRLLSFPNFQHFQKQSTKQKLLKYWGLFQCSIRFVLANREMVVYTIDLTACSWFLILKKIFFWKHFTIIFHPFEMYEVTEYFVIDDVFFKIFCFFKKDLDLLLIPEINRLKHFLALSGFPSTAANTLVFPNTNDNLRQYIDFKKQKNNKIVIGHIGAVGTNHYIKQLLTIAQSLPDDVELWFLGMLKSDILALIAATGLSNIKIIGQVPHRYLVDYYKQIDIGLILYRDVGLNFKYCAPNKLYEYWSFGIPVIAHPLEGLVPLFTSPTLGVLTDMDNTAEFSSNLNTYITNLRSASMVSALRTHFKSHHDIQVYLNQLTTLLPLSTGLN